MVHADPQWNVLDPHEQSRLHQRQGGGVDDGTDDPLPPVQAVVGDDDLEHCFHQQHLPVETTKLATREMQFPRGPETVMPVIVHGLPRVVESP